MVKAQRLRRWPIATALSVKMATRSSRPSRLLVVAVLATTLWLATMNLLVQLVQDPATTLVYFTAEINHDHQTRAVSVASFAHGKAPQQDRKRYDKVSPFKIVKGEETAEKDETNHDNHLYPVAGLNCDRYGGPYNDDDDNFDLHEMVYWRDIPMDAYNNNNNNNFVSPFASHRGNDEYYLTFETDEGGFNNIRMAFESTVAVAIATGRTLVLPPPQVLYRLEEDTRQQKSTFDFGDFYPLKAIEAEHPGIFKTITLEDFLQQQALTGRLRDKVTGKLSLPPQNGRTDWTGITNQFSGPNNGKELWSWLRSVTTQLPEQYGECPLGIPHDASVAAMDHLRRLAPVILQEDAYRQQQTGQYPRNQPAWQSRLQQFDGNPPPVHAPPQTRLAELLGRRTHVCLYDEMLQAAPVLHIPGDLEVSRLDTHFYTYLYFQNWRHDLWMKRFVRDHLRYMDEIQCAAARVVRAVRRVAAQSNHKITRDKDQDHGNQFDSIHVRRGDFDPTNLWLSAQDIYWNNTRGVIQEGRTVYVATDETNNYFFDPLRKHYNLVFLKDFQHLLQGVNTNYYGMIDQLVASRGETFFGALYSTFSAYIHRLRGYHVQKRKSKGYKRGIINSYFYTPSELKHRRNTMRQYTAPRPPYWEQEWATAWRDIDFDVPEEALVG